MEKALAAAMGTLISGVLIILNERLKICSERKKQKDKLKIWRALAQTGPAPASLEIEDLCERARLDKKKVEPLVFEIELKGT